VLLAQAADLAIETARRDAEDELAPAPPAVLRPMLTWRRGTRVAAARAASVSALEDPEFRARVRSGATPDSVDRASWLVLERPEGWEGDLEELIAQLAEQRQDGEAAAGKLRDAELAATVTELRRHVAVQARDLAKMAKQCDQHVGRIAELTDELDRQRDMARVALDERREAVRDLKQMERRLAERTVEWKAAMATHVAPETAPVAVQQVVDAAVAAAAAAVQAAHSALGERIAALGLVLRGHEPDAQPLPGGDRPSSKPPQQTRRPVRLGRGLRIDTVAGVQWLVRRPGAMVFIDGYNVTMLAWPAMSAAEQRDRLEQGCAKVAMDAGTVVIVFDGEGAGGRPARSVGSSVRVRYTDTDTEADDEILHLVAQVPLGQPVIVVSNDRRVVDGAAALGANTVSSTTWTELLRT